MHSLCSPAVMHDDVRCACACPLARTRLVQTITVLLGASVSSGMACEVRFSSGDIQQCLAARLRPLASDVYAVEASRASGGGGGVPGGGGFLSQAEVDILKGADTTLNVVTDMLKDDGQLLVCACPDGHVQGLV